MAADGAEEVDFSLFQQNLFKNQIEENRNSEPSTQNSSEIWMGELEGAQRVHISAKWIFLQLLYKVGEGDGAPLKPSL